MPEENRNNERNQMPTLEVKKYNILIWLDIKTQCGLNRLEEFFKKESLERKID